MNRTNQTEPANIEAEESILGGILLEPNALHQIKSNLTPAMFFLRSHQMIYKAIIELDKSGKVTDLINLSEFLASRDLLDTVGGTAKLGQLLNRTVSATNIDRYAQLVIDKWKRRELIKLSHELLTLGYKTEIELSKLTQLVDELVLGWLTPHNSNQSNNLIGKIVYCATAKQNHKSYEETIKLEAEIDFNLDPKEQIKKLQTQAQQLLSPN